MSTPKEEIRARMGVQKSGETHWLVPWQFSVVVDPLNPLYDVRALDPADPGMTADLATGPQIHPVVLRKNGKRVLEDGDPLLHWQKYGAKYDPAHPLKVGDTIDHMELVVGRGRTASLKEVWIAAERTRPDDLAFFVAKHIRCEVYSLKDLPDADAKAMMTSENANRRAETFKGKVTKAMDLVREHAGNPQVAALKSGVSIDTIRNWQGLWALNASVKEAVWAEKLGARLAWKFFGQVTTDKQPALLQAFFDAASLFGADAEKTLFRLVEEINDPAAARARAAALAAEDQGPQGAAAPGGAPATATPGTAAKPAKTRGGKASAPNDPGSRMRTRAAVSHFCEAVGKATKVAKAAKAERDERDMKVAYAVGQFYMGNDDALRGLPHIRAAIAGEYAPAKAAE